MSGCIHSNLRANSVPARKAPFLLPLTHADDEVQLASCTLWVPVQLMDCTSGSEIRHNGRDMFEEICLYLELLLFLTGTLLYGFLFRELWRRPEVLGRLPGGKPSTNRASSLVRTG